MSRRSRRTFESLTPFHSSTPPQEEEPATGHRQARLEHILADELQSLLRDEATDPALEGINVLSVHLSPDAGHARVAYAVTAPLQLEQEKGRSSKAGLERATGFLRSRLASHLNLKKLPKLGFTFVGLVAPTSGGTPCPE